METTRLDRELDRAQAALLARHAPGTRARRIRWSGGGTQVLELGSGPPLLLVHGGGDCAIEWVPILARLARTRRVLAVDRPGHGLADPFDYRGVDVLEHARTFLGDVLDALGLPAADVAASSMGGLWSAAFALHAPERVTGLALLGAPPGVTRWIPRQLRLLGSSVIGRPIGLRLLANPTRDSLRAFFGELLVRHPGRLDESFLDANAAHMRRNVETILGFIGRAAGVRGLERALLLGEGWCEIEVPTLLLLGDHDAFVGPGDREAWAAIAARNPNVRVRRVPDAGHLPWLDAPERVAAETERFLTAASETYEHRRIA